MSDPQIIICECAVRDGLQHESEFMPTESKVELIDVFSRIGFRRIEATSFSHPKYVPQFADAEEVLRHIGRRNGVSYKATCVNAKAVERAVASVAAGAGPDEISMVVSASESHQLRNTKRTHAELRREFEQMASLARQSGLRIVGTVGTAFGCPFTGEVPLSAVEQWAGFFVDLGIEMITLGDTTGMANPAQVRDFFGLGFDRLPDVELTAHFHNTRGQGLANALAALEAGCRSFESSFGELGGCPVPKGATGNVATEDLVSMLHEMGRPTGIDLARLHDCSREVQRVLGRPLGSHLLTAGPIDWRRG